MIADKNGKTITFTLVIISATTREVIQIITDWFAWTRLDRGLELSPVGCAVSYLVWIGPRLRRTSLSDPFQPWRPDVWGDRRSTGKRLGEHRLRRIQPEAFNTLSNLPPVLGSRKLLVEFRKPSYRKPYFLCEVPIRKGLGGFVDPSPDLSQLCTYCA